MYHLWNTSLILRYDVSLSTKCSKMAYVSADRIYLL